MKKYSFEIRQIDALREEDNIWYWNSSIHIGEFTTSSDNVKRAFLNALHKNNIVCKKGKCIVVDDGEILELQDRKTQEPLFAAIPNF